MASKVIILMFPNKQTKKRLYVTGKKFQEVLISVLIFFHWTTAMGFPHSSVGKESTCNTGDPGSTPGSGRSTGEGIGYPFQYSLAFLGSAGKESTCNAEVRSLGWEDSWRRESLPTPVFWPGEFHGLHSAWGRNESDMTEQLSLSLTF